jgi:hypothetical protein
MTAASGISDRISGTALAMTNAFMQRVCPFNPAAGKRFRADERPARHETSAPWLDVGTRAA